MAKQTRIEMNRSINLIKLDSIFRECMLLFALRRRRKTLLQQVQTIRTIERSFCR